MAKASQTARNKTKEYHGSCRYFRLVPDIVAKGNDSVNILMEFEDALKLAAAIQSAVFTLNRYNRGTKAGRKMGMALSLRTKGSGSLSVWHVTLRPAPKKSAKGVERNGKKSSISK